MKSWISACAGMMRKDCGLCDVVIPAEAGMTSAGMEERQWRDGRDHGKPSSRRTPGSSFFVAPWRAGFRLPPEWRAKRPVFPCAGISVCRYFRGPIFPC